MKKTLILTCLSLLAALSVRGQGWIPLFNGKDLKNWEHVGEGKFFLEDGMLKTDGGMGLLWYKPRKWANIRLKVVYKGADANNAGVFIRIPEKPTEPWMPVKRGYEVQIDDREDDYHKTGVLYSMTKAKASPGKAACWNEMIITLDGARTTVKVNGVLVTDYREGDAVPAKVHDYEPDRGPRPKAGYIGLQNHGSPDVIVFKEISYQPI
ncbi:MAG: DUF1080 domain-containing protein [Bacteroidota bacterium]